MNPFAPLALGPESAWSAKDHQNAANFAFYELQGAQDGADIGFFRAMHNDHSRKAARLRGIPGKHGTQILNRMDLPV